MAKNEAALERVAGYYSDKVVQHGATPRGVDWNGEDSQLLRFTQLCNVLPRGYSKSFSINDLGCGYAALNDYLSGEYQNYKYTGYDVSTEMVEASLKRLQSYPNSTAICSGDINEVADYSVASGVFNVRLDTPEDEWLTYIKSVLMQLNDSCRTGFSFNCLTSYSDSDKMRDYLYYAEPEELFKFCKTEFSRNVALMHDYDLYEFTIVVRK